MMVIFLNADGTAQNVTPEHVYQGSNNVTEITVVAPFAATTAMQIGFILPNGLYWQSTDGARYAPMKLAEQDVNTDVTAWSFTLPLSVTEQQGDVFVAINALTPTGNTTSYLCKFTVEESVLPNLPSSPDPSVYDLIQQYLARLDGRTANVPNLVASIQKESGNSFSYTDNSGVKSEPIALGEIDYNPTYVGAASVIKLPASAWQPTNPGSSITGYTLTITAAQHGQMRDGVTADDLLVDFKQEVIGGGSYSGYNASYTISQSGDITVRSNSLLNFAVVAIIWNGKGLADMTARNDIAAETAARESADANLQQQIDEIVDSGVDLTARADIAAETERAKAAEATLQENITAEAARAQSAEQGLQSAVNTNAANIQDLRDDVTEIESYIPSSTSAGNQLADKAFVNSSINDIAAFYIESNAQGDAFPTRAALLGATTFYHAGQTRAPTQNDYAIVLADESQPQGVDGKYPTTRYSYQTNAPGGTYPNGQWGFKYVVNNTSLTQAQVNTINSGITQSLVAQIGENETAIAAEVSARASADADLQQRIDTLSAGAVYSVNGETGDVTITPAKIGAYPSTGGVLTGNATIKTSGYPAIILESTVAGTKLLFELDPTGGQSIIKRKVSDNSNVFALAIPNISGYDTIATLKTAYCPTNLPTQMAIEQGTANAYRNVWFADNTNAGKPVYNTQFQYNPSTNDLKVGTINGAKPYSSNNPPSEEVVVKVGSASSTSTSVSFTAGNKYDFSAYKITGVTDNFVGGIVATGTSTSISTVVGLAISTTQFVALFSRNVTISPTTTFVIIKTNAK